MKSMLLQWRWVGACLAVYTALQLFLTGCSFLSWDDMGHLTSSLWSHALNFIWSVCSFLEMTNATSSEQSPSDRRNASIRFLFIGSNILISVEAVFGAEVPLRPEIAKSAPAGSVWAWALACAPFNTVQHACLIKSIPVSTDIWFGVETYCAFTAHDISSRTGLLIPALGFACCMSLQSKGFLSHVTSGFPFMDCCLHTPFQLNTSRYVVLHPAKSGRK